MSREKCGGCGKDVFPTKDQAQAYLSVFRSLGTRRRGKVYPCVFGSHWHVTKGNPGQKGKGVR